VGSSPDLLAEFKGRRKEELGREWVKQGWDNNRRRGRDGGGKGGICTHPTSGPLQLFSRGCACVSEHVRSEIAPKLEIK